MLRSLVNGVLSSRGGGTRRGGYGDSRGGMGGDMGGGYGGGRRGGRRGGGGMGSMVGMASQLLRRR